MANILLIEPDYNNKYPPVGLMKISYFHKYIHNDYVRFAKGKLPDSFRGIKWDRVYVATLFTFEWENTKKAIEYALTVVKDSTQVYIGGILSTLMPDLITEHFPQINNCVGRLNKNGTLGLKGEECIDNMTLDYGILDDIADQYVYPEHNAYFTYMTRGCGMKCQFCAVQTLEPDYIPYLSITESIKRVNEKFGPKKDLLLMDNNVLRSPDFDNIIDEIKALGFQKGARVINPKTGKKVNRFVDFNQGLDAFLLTPYKASRLGELALKPARIAFDHIEDVDAYKKAITLCAENGITNMSNYLLYNGDAFTGKGRSYSADTPEDLYNRMKISMDLCDELNEKLEYKVSMFSFPMRYTPLNALNRTYIGTMWNKKYLRAVQVMMIPTMGKGASSRSFFETAFGRSEQEFLKFLLMPEKHLGWRGDFIPRRKETDEEIANRKIIWDENQEFIEEWNFLYSQLGNTKKEFTDLIGENKFTINKFIEVSDPLHKKLLIHYFSPSNLLKSVQIEDDNSRKLVVEYISNGFPLFYKRLVQHIVTKRISYDLFEGAYKVFGLAFVKDVINNIDFDSYTEPYVVKNLSKLQIKSKKTIFDYELVRYYFMYNKLNFMSTKMKSDIISAIRSTDEIKTRELLLNGLNNFRDAVIAKTTHDQKETEATVDKVEKQLNELYKYLNGD